MAWGKQAKFFLQFEDDQPKKQDEAAND